MTLPKPYYEDAAVTIYHGDCRDILPHLSGVDLVLTDPPYNIGFSHYLGYRDEQPAPEYVEMLALLGKFERIAISHYPEEMMRYVVPALGAPDHVSAWVYNQNQPRRFRLINYYGLEPDYKRIPQPYKNLDDKRVQALITRGSEGSPLYEWWSDIEIVRNVSEEKLEHPCPMPLRLMRRLVTLCTEKSWTVLDPFMGSGTSLRAAVDLGRKAIGIDLEERYCEIAAKRMSQGVLL